MRMPVYHQSLPATNGVDSFSASDSDSDSEEEVDSANNEHDPSDQTGKSKNTWSQWQGLIAINSLLASFITV